MALNIVATAIPIFFLQLLIQPLMAKRMGGDAYGLFITILALLNVIPSTMGNALNNVRLIMHRGTEELRAEGDYNVVLTIMAVLNLIAMTCFTLYYEGHVTLTSLFLTLVVSLLFLLREYHIVAFRLKLNYTAILVNNIIMVAGYALGYLLFTYSGHWQDVYLIGYLISLIYVFARSSLWREPIRRTERFRAVGGQTTMLTIAAALGRITTYADKLLIFPVLGGTVVSIYYAATLFGKVVSLTITPVSSVMLSYLSRATKKNDSTFRLVMMSALAVGTVGYFLCVAISRPVLTLLYPQFVDASMQYIWLTTGTMVMTALISIANPFVLKFFDMKYQIVINLIYVVVYVGVSMLLLMHMGLFGFCIGSLSASVLKFVSMLFIYRTCKERTV